MFTKSRQSDCGSRSENPFSQKETETGRPMSNDAKEGKEGKEGKEISCIPGRKFYGESMSCLVYVLHVAHENEVAKALEGKDPGTLLGYRVPFFQRNDDRWSRVQQIAFIESMYMGANIGAFMVNQPSLISDPEIDNVLLDGLQRLTALKAYFNGDFAVTGADEKPHVWTELASSDRAHLLRLPYPWIQTRYNSVELMKEAYERHNFGGTAHTPDDQVRLKNAKP